MSTTIRHPDGTLSTYADKHCLEINYLDRYGSLLVAQVE